MTTKVTKTLKELAEILDAKVFGDGDFVIDAVCHPLSIETDNSLVLATDPRALPALQFPNANAAIVGEGRVLPEGLVKGYLACKRPRVAFAKLFEIFEKPLHKADGIHPSAVIDPTAQVHPSASVGALSYVGPEAVVGENTNIMPHVTIGAQAVVGNNCIVHSGSRIGERVKLGNQVILQHNVSLGADGFSYVTPDKGSIESARESAGTIEAKNTEILRINSLGTVILEDQVEVGANATIDRANVGATVIKKGTKIDNLVMIGHNNTIGENCMIVAQAGIAGSCDIKDRVVMAAQSGVKDHLTIGEDSIITARAAVMYDVPEKAIMAGVPAQEHRKAFQNYSYYTRIKDMHKDLTDLKKEVAKLTKDNKEPANV